METIYTVQIYRLVATPGLCGLDTSNVKQDKVSFRDPLTISEYIAHSIKGFEDLENNVEIKIELTGRKV